MEQEITAINGYSTLSRSLEVEPYHQTWFCVIIRPPFSVGSILSPQRVRRCLSIFIYLPNPFAQTGWDTKSILKRRLIVLNSEFSFCTGCHTKAYELSVPDYFTHSWRENNWIHTLPMGVSTMWNVKKLIRVTVSISYDDIHYTASASFDCMSTCQGLFYS